MCWSEGLKEGLFRDSRGCFGIVLQHRTETIRTGIRKRLIWVKLMVCFDENVAVKRNVNRPINGMIVGLIRSSTFVFN
ncbi:hypothetical protein QVD17_05117 [Tagetes erecta]|uniref:Uncharacterized protein n=1 Tax=Tagetes erecta TaxID=13708 RepID=A0AAD8LHZ2_TARER|nr:hypothetical protein QVD17_05117 [Tagetes erecta]